MLKGTVTAYSRVYDCIKRSTGKVRRRINTENNLYLRRMLEAPFDVPGPSHQQVRPIQVSAPHAQSADATQHHSSGSQYFPGPRSQPFTHLKKIDLYFPAATVSKHARLPSRPQAGSRQRDWAATQGPPAARAPRESGLAAECR